MTLASHRKRIITAAGILVALLSAFACMQNDRADHGMTYTCPMHPAVKSDRPGTCPVCGMDLVRELLPGEEVEITTDLSTLMKGLVGASVRAIRGTYESLDVTVDAKGIVTYDTRSLFTIPAKTEGRLERVYLRYAFQRVARGQKIADIYSAELLAAQREFLLLLDNSMADSALIEAAEKKLGFLGMTQEQIRSLRRSRQTSPTIAVYSPYNGYILPTAENAPNMRTVRSVGMGGTMAPGAEAMQATGSRALSVREGEYVREGQTLFLIANDDALRIELALPPEFGDKVATGTHVKLDAGSGSLPATVELVQPFFSENQEFVMIRVRVTPSDFKVGQLVDATVWIGTTESLWVPRSAVVDLGMRKVVFVKTGDAFSPRTVATGIRTEEMIELKKGLASTEEIAANAQFLVGNESFINVD